MDGAGLFQVKGQCFGLAVGQAYHWESAENIHMDVEICLTFITFLNFIER